MFSVDMSMLADSLYSPEMEQGHCKEMEGFCWRDLCSYQMSALSAACYALLEGLQSFRPHGTASCLGIRVPVTASCQLDTAPLLRDQR